MKLYRLCFLLAMATVISLAMAVMAVAGEYYCKINAEPNPLLLGTHSGITHTGATIKITLEKRSEGYWAYYIFKPRQGKGMDRNVPFEITGDRMVNAGWPSGNGDVKFFVKDGNFYFQWKSESPVVLRREGIALAQ